MHNEFEDNSSLYNVNLNHFTRPQEPTVSDAVKKSALKLAVLNELAFGGSISGYSDRAVWKAYQTLADALMIQNGYTDRDGNLTLEALPDGTARILRSDVVMSKSLRGK